MGSIPSSFEIDLLPLRLRFRMHGVFGLAEFPGSLIRGVLGRALKDLVCVAEHRDCVRCVLRAGCPYPSLIEPVRPEGIDVFAGERTIPPPYVLSWDRAGRVLREGDVWTVGVTLIGPAARLAGHVVAALSRGAQRGFGPEQVRASLDRVEAQAPEGWVVLDPGRLPERARGVPFRRLAGGAGAWGGEVALAFRTPARITSGGKLRENPTGAEVLRARLRRVGALAAFYGRGAHEAEARHLSRQAEGLEASWQDRRWVEVSRYSGRQRTRMKFGGVVGVLRLKGDLGPWAPWLSAGCRVHVGKNASFGLGRYELGDANGAGGN
ncbi:MAG: CRISPR system precrRNA processing endoribonuclease RAMP protein Cas6 [Planctomycetota bacterium]